MRMLMNVRFPHEPFNTLVRSGRIGQIIERVIEDIKPESIYFTELDGNRAATIVVTVREPSDIPSLSEPFFLYFNATCEFRIAMTAKDLSKAHLERLGSRYQIGVEPEDTGVMREAGSLAAERLSKRSKVGQART